MNRNTKNETSSTTAAFDFIGTVAFAFGVVGLVAIAFILILNILMFFHLI